MKWRLPKEYCELVLSSKQPYEIPLLIPELRYGGLQTQHRYRLDFTIINPYTLQKQGFEFSPLVNTWVLIQDKGKKSKEINLEARANFEKEMQKHKEYYRKFNIFTLIYTDSDLQNLDQIFEEMQQYLKPEHENRQILEATLEEFKRFSFIESTLIPSPYQSAFFINTGHVAADVISSAATF